MGLGRGDLSGGESTSSSEASLPRRFPVAAQPEIMRAAEKDDQYASFVYDACRDAFRHLFGSYRFFIICFLPLLAISPFYLISILWFRYKGCCSLSEGGQIFNSQSFSFQNSQVLSKTIFTTKKIIFVIMHCGQHISCYIVFPVFLILQTKLLGQMLYYVLTTGSGQQTLGEEYCDITQVSTHYLLS